MVVSGGEMLPQKERAYPLSNGYIPYLNFIKRSGKM